MLRFMAFAWHEDRADRSEEIRACLADVAKHDAAPWSLGCSAPGLEVWWADGGPNCSKPVVLPDGGVLLGRVLSRAKGYPTWKPEAQNAAASSHDPAVRTQWLFASVWGSYVGFLPRSPDHPPAVLRDPAGGLPCFRTNWRDFDVFTSNVELFRALPGLSISIDYRALAIDVRLPLVCKARTCLAEIEKILPGECLLLGTPLTRKFLWDPIAISGQPLKVGTAQAAELLRETIREVTAALARPYPRILLNLGGLDSSILLTCLAALQNGSDIDCVNFYTDALSGDERRYTAGMAAHVGVDLVEQRLDPDLVDLDLWGCQEMGASPPPMFDALTQAGDVHALAANRDAAAMFYGTGGDSVFYQVPDIFSALDYVSTGFASGRLLRTAVEAAQYGGRSLAYTAREMIREKIAPRRCHDTILGLLDTSDLQQFLGREMPADWRSPRNLHPMLEPDDAFPKGKYYHILSSAFFDTEMHRYRFPTPRDIDHVCPLVAQPVIELCLKIPTWQLADGGVNRGLARRAFWQDLPRAVAGRTSKSTTESIYDRLIARHLPKLRETLLDGKLAKAGFLKREQLELALGSSDRLSINSPAMLFDLFAWESWARKW